MKKQGNTTFVAGFENIFSGSGWGEVKPIVFEEPPKKVEEPAKAVEEKPQKTDEVKKEEVKKESDIKSKADQNG